MTFFQGAAYIFDRIRPVIDVAIIAFLLYRAWKIFSGTQAVQLLKGAGFLGFVYGIAVLFDFSALRWLLTAIAPGLVIIIAIVFQPELRKVFLRLGQGGFFTPSGKPRLDALEAAVSAAEILSRERRGMLIVFARRINIKDIIETGTKLNAEISSSLIISIFKYDTPLHDGAMILQNNRIAAAGCLLPLSDQENIKKSFGTRHRAALGITEQSDAVVLIVSEETGAISTAFDGKMHYNLPKDEIIRRTKDFFERGIAQHEEIPPRNSEPSKGKEHF